MPLTKCDRCARQDGPIDEIPNPVRVRRYRIDGARETNLCDPCRDMTALYHTVDQVGARPPKAAPETEPEEAPPAVEGEWVHRGGGHYENTATGERRRGRPGGARSRPKRKRSRSK